MGNNSLKKEKELEVLSFFNPIYEHITDDLLKVVKVTERPDFIWEKKDGSLVGVELVEVRRGHPNDVLYDKIVNKNVNMHPYQAIDLIQTLIFSKEGKRKATDWTLSEKTILIVHLKESPLWEFAHALTEDLFPDIQDYGFSEIWLADFSEIDAFNNIELYCFLPSNMKGYYKRPLQKPYA